MSQTTTTPQPDVSQLRDAELPAARFPGSAGQSFRVFFSPDVHARVCKHAAENLGVEICGVLVGSWGKDGDGPFVAISEAIRGDAATSKFAEVTFTHETWAKINHEMDTRFAHLAIVGWYHTHPDFGVFLSDRDLFIQQHFFSGPGQVAYVLDPVRKTEGVFVWTRGKPAPAPYYWVGDRLQPAPAEAPPAPLSPAVPAVPSAGQAAAAAESGRPALPLGWLTQGLAYLCLFLLGFVLASRLIDLQRSHIERDAVARAALLLGVKPGLREALDRCLADLGDADREAEALAGAPAESQKEKGDALRTALARTASQLREVQAHYCLSPAESERMLQYVAAVIAMGSPDLSAEERDRLAQKLERQLKEQLKDGSLDLSSKPAGNSGTPPGGGGKDRETKGQAKPETKDKSKS